VLVTIKIKDLTMIESITNEISETLKEFKDIDAIESFAIREIRMGIAVKNQTWQDHLENGPEETQDDT
jgi:hypothetical protein